MIYAVAVLCMLFDIQVVVGGRNKYLINGCNATNTRVQDLFRSVQLNVNNPHFLIMQGRITKVLNMKPAEVTIIPCFVYLNRIAGFCIYFNHMDVSL